MTEDEIDARAGPLQFARFAIAPLEHVVIRSWLPCRAHVEQIHEEVIRERPGPPGEDAVLRLSNVGIQGAQAANENRHLRSAQGQQLRTIDQQFLCRYAVLCFEIVAEPISSRFEESKQVDVRLILRRISASWRERNIDIVTGIPRGLLDGCASTQDNQISK